MKITVHELLGRHCSIERRKEAGSEDPKEALCKNSAASMTSPHHVGQKSEGDVLSWIAHENCGFFLLGKIIEIMNFRSL